MFVAVLIRNHCRFHAKNKAERNYGNNSVQGRILTDNNDEMAEENRPPNDPTDEVETLADDAGSGGMSWRQWLDSGGDSVAGDNGSGGDDSGGGGRDGGSDDFDVSPISIEEEMRTSYLDYAMSVIVSRALPDVRDGLKPASAHFVFNE